MRTSRRIASALALALLGLAGGPTVTRAQALIGGNGFQNGFVANGINNGSGLFNNGFGGFGGFNNGFGGFNNGFGGFNNGFGGGFNGFAPMAAVGGGFGPMGFNNGGAVGFGFGGPMNGGMAMFSGNGAGFGGNFGGQQAFGFNQMGVMMPPAAFAANNLGGVAAIVEQQAMRRPGQPLPAVRRRRR